MSGFWLAMGAGRLGVGFLTRLFPLSRLIAVGATLGVPTLLMALLVHRRGLALAATLVCGLGFSGIHPSLMALAQVRHGGSVLLSSTMVAAGGAGGLIVPACFGFASARLGLHGGAGLLAAVLVPVTALPFAGARPPAPRFRTAS